MLNKVEIMGRLTRNPEVRYTQSNIPVASFTLAVDRNRAAQGQERKTDFIRCVAWRVTAEFVQRYFAKGQMMVLVGHIQVRSYDDDGGNKRSITEIVAEDVMFGETKKARESTGYSSTQNDMIRAQEYRTPGVNTDFSEMPDDGEVPF